jgi:hypothetical protein
MGKIADAFINLLKKKGHARHSRNIGPTFWNGKDIHGVYHDKKDLMETLKTIKQQKIRKNEE